MMIAENSIVMGPAPQHLFEDETSKRLYSWAYHRAELQAKQSGLDAVGVKAVARHMARDVAKRFRE